MDGMGREESIHMLQCGLEISEMNTSRNVFLEVTIKMYIQGGPWDVGFQSLSHPSISNVMDQSTILKEKKAEP